MRRQTCTLVIGAQGSGKSAGVVHYLATDVLPNEPACHIYTNLSLNVEALAAFVEQFTRRRRRKVTADDVRKRIHLLDRESMAALRTDITQGGMTPHEYFKDTPLRGGLLILDEGHRYCGDQFSFEHVHTWCEWLAELRHDVGPGGGASAMMLSIGRGNFPNELEMMSGALWSIAPTDELRDPFFNVPLKDWYEIEAAFIRGKMVPGCEVTIKTRSDRSWQKKYSYFVRLEDWIFQFYDSFSARMEDQESGEKSEKEAPQQYRFQQMSRWELVRWFLSAYPQTWMRTVLVVGGCSLLIATPYMITRGYKAYRTASPIGKKAAAPVRPPIVHKTVDPSKLPAVGELLNDLPGLPITPVSKTSAKLPAGQVSIDAIVGKRFYVGGVWYGIGDLFEGAAVTEVDCDRGVARMSDGRAGAVRGAGISVAFDLASLSNGSPQPAFVPGGVPGRGGPTASNGPAGSGPTDGAAPRRIPSTRPAARVAASHLPAER